MKREFLHEMKLEYDRRNLASDSLAGKTRDLMTVSVIMIAGITAFYGHMWSIAEEKVILLHLPIIGISLLGASTLLCVLSNGKEFQRTVFLGDKMTERSEIKEEVVKSWTDYEEDDFYASLIKEYLLCLKDAEDVMKKKATSLTKSIKLFAAGWITFPVLVAISLVF